MRIGNGKHTYEWIENWAEIPGTDSARNGWAHHGAVVTEAGHVIASHPGEPKLLEFDPAGQLLRAWDTGLKENHGIVITKENGTEYLWIADNGRKRSKQLDYEYPPQPNPGRAIKMTLDGKTVMTIQQPDLPVYQKVTYMPTWVAVFEERHGGNGDIWIADGYGANCVYRYNRSGQMLGSINGAEGEAGLFNCPHSVWVDTRKSAPELYVADRGNRRVQVYDLEGHYKRVFGADFMSSPSGFAVHGDDLIIAELRARITIIDTKDKLVCHLGSNEDVCSREGWPNMKNDKGIPVRPTLIEGLLNGPHGIAADRDGNIYVFEWLIGGRTIKLAKV